MEGAGERIMRGEEREKRGGGGGGGVEVGGGGVEVVEVAGVGGVEEEHLLLAPHALDNALEPAHAILVQLRPNVRA